MNPKIDELSPRERLWVNTQVDKAARFVDTFSPQDCNQPLTLAGLDRAFAAWISSKASDQAPSVNEVLNAVGTAFGQFLVDGLKLKWVIVTDEKGSDLAVHGLPSSGDVIVYPANFVAKRWERRETAFLENSYQSISKQLEAIHRQHR